MPFNKETASSAGKKSVESKRFNQVDPAKLARRVIITALHKQDTRVALEVAKEMGLFKTMASQRPDTDMAAQAIGALLAGSSGTGDTDRPSDEPSSSNGSVAHPGPYPGAPWCKVCQGWHEAGASHNGRRGDRAIARAEARLERELGEGSPGTETQAAAKGGVGEIVATQSHKIFPDTPDTTDSEDVT